MKTRLLFAAVLASTVFAPAPLIAQQPGPGKEAQVQTAPDVKAFDKRLAEADAQFKRMQEQMDRLRQAQDPQERQRLMQEHWASMHSAMTTMHGMWGPGMMGCCGSGTGTMGHGMMMGPGMMRGQGMMGWGGMQPYYNKLTPEQMKQRQYMMDRYMGMQQMMMDHMLQQQQWMMQPPPVAPTT